MKDKLLTVYPAAHATDVALLIARIAVAALMLTHGLPKLAMLFSGEPVQFAGVYGLSPQLSLGLAIFAEVVCSLLVLVGLGTRLAVIPLIITMLVAAFYIHAADPFMKKEPALQYLLVYVVLFFAGSGRYSVDNSWQRQSLKPALSMST
ncbi:DoxX family protein [Adhaeribacter radiodurans]|uniref:DoxX family protein n=1 Tax=Adhaeribacter radiodurans TaxID=2745197 RepID=A0A7L7L5R9_9BACT|nr:DoxX family protein [Adhaeribacter radiodurans]QMU28161.1 DoxX family protein [Adhaeribacter radiodurans]